MAAPRAARYLNRELAAREESELRAPYATLPLFTRQLALLLRSGVHLIDSLEVLLKQTEHPEFRLVLQRLQAKLSAGNTLSKAMSAFPRVFSPVAIGLVHSGERSGALVAVLERLADLYERGLRRRGRVLSSLAYPCVLLLCMGVVGLVFVFFVAPGDEGLYALASGPIPWPSRVLMALASPPLWLGAALVAGLAAVAAVQFRRRYPLWVDAQLLRLPVVGRLLRHLEASRLLEVLSATVRVGFDVLGALKLSQQVAGNREFQRRYSASAQSVFEGHGLGHSLRLTGLFPGYVTATIEVAEASGKLPQSLHHLSQSLDEDAQQTLESLTQLLGPLLLFVSGLGAGFIALAVFLPIVAVTLQG